MQRGLACPRLKLHGKIRLTSAITGKKTLHFLSPSLNIQTLKTKLVKKTSVPQPVKIFISKVNSELSLLISNVSMLSNWLYYNIYSQTIFVFSAIP